MPTYTYIANSRTGERMTGTVEANDKRSALLQVERMGYVPVSLKEGEAPAPKLKSGGKRKSGFKAGARGPRMGMREVLFFTRELSDLLASGMTLGHALNTLAQRETGKAQDVIITQLRDEIVQGTSLSDALAKRSTSFGTLYVSMVRAGEASGDLAGVLERLCKHYERVQEAREKVLMALSYPVIVLLVGILTIIFVMTFVVPRFSQMFSELGSTLPLPTQMLIGISGALINYWWLILLVLFTVVALARGYLRTPEGTRRWHQAQLRMPVFKGIIRANAFSQFARTLGALLNNGVPVLQALSIVENTVGNRVIADEIRNARSRVTDGATISAPLAAGKVFPALLTDMLAVGEETGDMSGSLNHIANRYEHELDRAVKLLTTIIEPVLILLIAVMVGFVAISMLLAVSELTSGLNV
jgi:type IV pilus assembly protein PilC